MGQYTELKTNFHLKIDTPMEIIKILKYIADNETELPYIPDHKLFKCDRWTHLFNCSSAYFNNEKYTEIELDGEKWYVNTRANFKNYDHEIQLFWDWITPYIDSTDDKQIGEISINRYSTEVVYLNNGVVAYIKELEEDD